jgi:hypothetical protein
MNVRRFQEAFEHLAGSRRVMLLVVLLALLILFLLPFGS